MDAQTAASFLSPRKRRSSALEGDVAGLMSPIRSKNVSNPSKKAAMFRSQHSNALPFDAPVTPGSDRSFSLMETPEKQPQHAPSSLSGLLSVLPEYLNGLYVTAPMVLKRGSLLTFSGIKTPLQNMTGHTLKLQHLQQIKELSPSAFEWRHVLVPNPTTRRQEQQLLLLLPDKQGQSKATQQLQQALERLADAQGSAAELRLAVLPPPASAPVRGDATPSRTSAITGTATPGATAAGGGSSTVPSTPQMAACGAALVSPQPGVGTPGVPTPAQTAAPSTHSGLFSPVANRRSRLGGAAADSAAPAPRAMRLFGTPQDASKTAPRPSTAGAAGDLLQSPAAGPRGVPAVPRFQGTAAGNAAARLLQSPPLKVRKLSFDEPAKAASPAAPSPSAAAAAQGSNSVGKVASDGTTEASAAGGAKRPVGRGLVFEPGQEVLKLLQKVTDKPTQERVAAAKAGRAFERQLDLLPSTFDSLRAVYGEKGPCVMAKQELLLLLRQRSSSRSGMSAEDAQQQLTLVIRTVPGWVTEVTAPGRQLAALTTNVRLNRRMPWAEARSKLLAAAEKLRADEAAAEGVADEEVAGQGPAAAAASEVSEDGAAGSRQGQDSDPVLLVVVDEDRAAQLHLKGLLGKENQAAAAAGAMPLGGGGGVGAAASGSSSDSSSKQAAAPARQQARRAALGMFDEGPSSAAGGPGLSGDLLACLAFNAPPLGRK